MGGYGAWALAAQNPERFATLVIVCGGIIWPPNAARRRIKPGPENPYTRTAQAVSRLPIWLFHGDRYPNVPVTESRRMLAALLSLNANVQYTEYKGMAHRIWDEAYDGPQVPLWLLGQAKR
jgi:predicted peptidase